MRWILAPQTRRATSFHTCCSHLPGDPPKGLQNDGIGGFGMRTRLWRAAEGGSRAPTRPLDRSNLNFDDRETFFGSDLLAAHCWRRGVIKVRSGPSPRSTTASRCHPLAELSVEIGVIKVSVSSSLTERTSDDDISDSMHRNQNAGGGSCSRWVPI